VLTAKQLPALHAAVLATCDANDGQADGLLSDPGLCHFDPASIACPPRTHSNGCLTPDQIDAVRALYAGPHTADGTRLYPGGLPYGSELAWVGWTVPPHRRVPPSAVVSARLGENYLHFLGFPIGLPTASLAAWSFDVAGYQRLIPEAIRGDALDPDLSAFEQRGGKLILWHGWADQAIPPYGTIDYYARLVRESGGFGRTRAFARLFLIPSMYHCFGGYGPQAFSLIDDLVAWVEEGSAPDDLLVSGGGPGTPDTITVRPYPEGTTGDLGGRFPDEIDWIGERQLYRGGPR
jgi:hypothetical protein